MEPLSGSFNTTGNVFPQLLHLLSITVKCMQTIGVCSSTQMQPQQNLAHKLHNSHTHTRMQRHTPDTAWVGTLSGVPPNRIRHRGVWLYTRFKGLTCPTSKHFSYNVNAITGSLFGDNFSTFSRGVPTRQGLVWMWMMRLRFTFVPHRTRQHSSGTLTILIKRCATGSDHLPSSTAERTTI